MTPHERAAQRRERRKAGLPTDLQRRQWRSTIVYELKRGQVGWSSSRAIKHIRSLWDVPREDLDLWFTGRRDG